MDPTAKPIAGSSGMDFNEANSSGVDFSEANSIGMDFNEANSSEEISDLIKMKKRKFPSVEFIDSKKPKTELPHSESPLSFEKVGPLKGIASVCQNFLTGKILSAAAYGVESNIYQPPTIADMELSPPKYLLLALLHSLVAGDVNSCVLLAKICDQVNRLRSRDLRVWLLEDFSFPRTDIENAMSLLTQLVADGTLKMPDHIMAIMNGVASHYRIPGVQLRTLSEECLCGLAVQLENAVINNSPRDIFDLVSEGGDVNGKTQSGDSLLHVAARSGSSATITALGILNADLEALNSNNATPLEVAVRHDCAPSVKASLMAGAKFSNCFFGGDTYLHIAAAGAKNKALETLLEGGIMNVNEKNHLGHTPLVQAVIEGNDRGIELLLKKGADLYAMSCVKLKDNDTIFHRVAHSGNIEALKLLNNRNLSANVKNNNGLTPLHVACNPSVVKILLRMGVPVDAQDNQNRTPLMMFAGNSEADVVSLLLLNRANPMKKDNNGKTPLYYAAGSGCIRSMTFLLDAGAKLDDLDPNHHTPAFHAFENNKPAILQLIVEKGDLSMERGGVHVNTILHHEVQSGHVGVVKALIDAGAMVNIKGEKEFTALHYAARRNDTAMVTALLDAGADLAARADGGKTPLMEASCHDRLAATQLLVDRGALINTRDNEGNTALGLACSRKTNLDNVPKVGSNFAPSPSSMFGSPIRPNIAPVIPTRYFEDLINYLKNKGGIL